MPTHQATVGTNPQTTQARRSERSRPERSRPVTPGGDSESFDFTNISGASSEEEEDQPPTGTRRPSTQPPSAPTVTQTTIPRTDSGINDPNIIASAKNKAYDVHYFYDKLPVPGSDPDSIYQCKFCK